MGLSIPPTQGSSDRKRSVGGKLFLFLLREVLWTKALSIPPKRSVGGTLLFLFLLPAVPPTLFFVFLLPAFLQDKRKRTLSIPPTHFPPEVSGGKLLGGIERALLFLFLLPGIERDRVGGKRVGGILFLGSS